MSIFDDLAVPTVSTGSYNTVLTLSRLIEYCQGVIPIDNAYFYNVMPTLLGKLPQLLPKTTKITKTSTNTAQFDGRNSSNSSSSSSSSSQTSQITFSQDDINYCIAQMLSQVTIPLRYSYLNTNSTSTFSLSQFLSQHSTQPRCHFFNVHVLPSPHRLANLPSLISPTNPLGTAKSTQHPSQQSDLLTEVDIRAAQRAGIVLPPNYHEQLNTNQRVNNTNDFIPWLQNQSNYNNSIQQQFQNQPYSPPIQFSSPPPIPLLRLGLSDGYTALFHPENRHLYSNTPIPTGKYLNLALFHSYNQHSLSLPKQLQYQHAKQTIADKFVLNFVPIPPHPIPPLLRYQKEKKVVDHNLHRVLSLEVFAPLLSHVIRF